MAFRHHDALRTFTLVARYRSLALAAEALNLTRGALSYKIRGLEASLGFALFERHARGMRLTAKGRDLLTTSAAAFGQIEEKIAALSGQATPTLTVGTPTYFAARWLSPRLADFMNRHPDVRLRIQAMIDVTNFSGEGVDLAIRWGDGAWRDCVVEPLIACPTFPAGNRAAFERVQREGEVAAFATFVLLREREGSPAWARWYRRAGLAERPVSDSLIIPDPNVRIEAVREGQGIALTDALIASELESGDLFRLSPHALEDYGYWLAYPRASAEKPAVQAFMAWIKAQ